MNNEGNFIDQIIQSWKQTDLKLNKPASVELLIDAQQKLGFVFPDDFVAFYKQADGFYDWDSVGNLFSFWPLEKIIEEYKSDSDKNFVAFCDHCINCFRVGYLKDGSGIFADIEQTEPIAQSLEEFITVIIENPYFPYR